MYKETELRNITNNELVSKFLINRFSSKKYRGLHLLQHERQTIDSYNKMLIILKKITNNGKMMIPSGDEYNLNKKQNAFYKLKDYPDYENFITKCKESELGGSPDSYKKISFVNLERIGLIKRYRMKNGEWILHKDMTKKFKSSHIEISNVGKKFIDTKDRIRKMTILGVGLSRLGGFSDTNALILYCLDQFSSLSRDEFALFVTFFHDGLNNETGRTYSIEEIIKIIHEFRNLSKMQKQEIMSFFKKHSKPKLSKKKSCFWDFHNFMNETDTIFSLTNEFGLWRIVNDEIIPTNDQEKGIFKRDRDKNVIKIYKEKFKLDTPNGWEYHHIYPIGYATDQQSLKAIDDYRNIVLISGTMHNWFPKRNNHYTIVNKEGNEIIFENLSGQKIKAIININIIVPNYNELKSYNDSLNIKI